MSRGDPKRLRLVASSALQRRVLDGTAQEEPSPELRDRMGRALGVSAATAAAGAALAKTTAAAAKASAKAGMGASAGTTSALPWVAVGALGLALVGAIAGRNVWKTLAPLSPHPAQPVIASTPGPAAWVESAPAAPVPAAPTQPATLAPDSPRPGVSATPSGHRTRATTPLDMREQTALVDAARDAVTSGAAERALTLLRRYQDKYPGGVFRPEVAALKIEALAKLGRNTEVRTLTDRFVAEYGDGPLTERVRRLSSSPRP